MRTNLVLIFLKNEVSLFKFVPHHNIMNKIIFIIGAFAIAACNSMPSTGNFGEKFEAGKPLSFEDAKSQYMAGKDTTYVIEGSVNEVCQHGQCWLIMKKDSLELFVNTHEKFKFPKDSKGKTAVAKGTFEKTEDGVEFVPTGVEIK